MLGDKRTFLLLPRDYRGIPVHRGDLGIYSKLWGVASGIRYQLGLVDSSLFVHLTGRDLWATRRDHCRW